MKKTLLFFALALLSTACFSQISVTGSVYLHDGDLARYASPDIYVSPQWQPIAENWMVRCTVVDPALANLETIEFYLTVTKATVDAETGTGTETEALIYAVEEVVINYLGGIAANSGTTYSH